MVNAEENDLNISIELPGEIVSQLGCRWTDLLRRALEALVAGACRESLASGPQVQEMLGCGRGLTSVLS